MSIPFEDFKPIEINMTLRKLMDMFPKTYMDYDYNRYGGPNGKSGWSDAKCAEYAGAFMKKKVGNTIFLYSLENNLKAFQDALQGFNPELLKKYDREEIERTIEYCSKLIDKGYKWAHAEGYNSQSTMYYWASGTLKKLAYSKYEKQHIQNPPLDMEKDKDGNWRVALGENGLPQYSRRGYAKLLDEGKAPMTEEEWHETLDRSFKTIILNEISLAELKHTIGVLNDNTVWLKSELRNSFDTDLAEFVRREDERWEKVFKRLHKPEGDKYDKFFQRREGQEMIARLISLWWPDKEYKLGTGSASLRKLYEEEQDVPKKLNKKLERIRKQLEDDTESLKPVVLNIATFMVLSICLEILDGLGYKLDDKEKDKGSRFLEWFTKQDALFTDLAAKRKAPKGMSQKEVQAEDYQYWKKNKDNKKNTDKIQKLWTAFLLTEKMGIEYLITSKLIKRKRDGQLEFKEKEMLKVRLHHSQKGKDRNGNDLPWLDIYRPGKLEIDHRLSVNDGGLAVESNAELMTKEENRRKGSKSNEPFPFENLREQPQPVLLEE
jgi:hypothetical protein